MEVHTKPISVIKMRLHIEPNGKVQRYFTHRCKVRMHKYVPYDTGTLADTAYEDVDKIVYPQKYATYVYKGINERTGEKLNIKTTKHRHATSRWDKKMWSIEKDKLTREVQRYFDRGAR